VAETGKMTKSPSLKMEDEVVLRRRIADGSQDPDDYLALADLFLSTDRDEEAISVCQQALALPLTHFQRARVCAELGWAFYELGRQAEALPLAQTAIGLLSEETENAEVLACRGRSQSLLAHCMWLKKDEDAKAKEAARVGLEYYERVINGTPSFPEIGVVYHDAARLHSLLGNTKIAILFCERCLQCELKEPQRLWCLNLLADCLRCEERLAEAESTLQEAFLHVDADKGTLPALYLTLGLIQRSSNRPAEARETFQKVLAALKKHKYLHDDPAFLTDIYWNLGELEYYAENLSEALKAFQQILVYHPDDDLDHRNALLWFGYCYQAMEEPQKAMEYFEKVLVSPNVSETEKISAKKGLAWNLGKIHYGVEEYREAATAFEEVIGYQSDDDRDRYNTLVWLGHCYFAIGDNGKARDCYEKVLASPHASDTDRISAQKGLVRSIAEISYQSGEHREAAEAFEQALNYYGKDDPYRPKILLSLGHCYLITGDPLKSRECYEEVLASSHASEEDKDSARKNLGWSLGKLYYELGDYRNATAAFQEVLTYYARDDSYYSRTLLWLGYSYQGKGDIDKAQECYEEVLILPHASADEKASARKGLSRLPITLKKTLH
jgi:tetratricopeptide (TPR) repeat protein